MTVPADRGAARAVVSEAARGPGGYGSRYLGVKIPTASIWEYYLRTAWTFADGPADRLFGAEGPHVRRRRCEGQSEFGVAVDD